MELACWRCAHEMPLTARMVCCQLCCTRTLAHLFACPPPLRTGAAGMDKEAVLAEVGSMRWGDFKPRLADALVAHMQPIQARYHEVMQDEGALDAILAKVRWKIAGRRGGAAVGSAGLEARAGGGSAGVSRQCRASGPPRGWAPQCSPLTCPSLSCAAGRRQRIAGGVRHPGQCAQGHGLWHGARPPLGRVTPLRQHCSSPVSFILWA